MHKRFRAEPRESFEDISMADRGSRLARYTRFRGNQLKKRYKSIPRGLTIKEHKFVQHFHPSSANVIVDANCHYSFTGTGAVGSGTLYGPATTDVGPAGYFSMKFTLADVPQAASFSALFDCYRIDKLKVDLIPVGNVVNQTIFGAGSLTAAPQWLSTVIDYDDSTLLTTEAALLDYESFKQTPSYRKHVRTFTPAVSMSAYKTSGTTIGYVQKNLSGWTWPTLT